MIKIIVLIIYFTLISGCANSPRYRTGPVTPRKTKQKPPSLKTVSKENYRRVITGVSSFYAEDFHGKLTANGEIYDMYGLTAAHKTLPLNTVARVTNMENDKSIILRINDRGPYVAGRILDCSYGAALKLGFIAQGTTKVKIDIIEFGDNKYMKQKS